LRNSPQKFIASFLRTLHHSLSEDFILIVVPYFPLMGAKISMGLLILDVDELPHSPKLVDPFLILSQLNDPGLLILLPAGAPNRNLHLLSDRALVLRRYMEIPVG
jgi:hypothetical protein